MNHDSQAPGNDGERHRRAEARLAQLQTPVNDLLSSEGLRRRLHQMQLRQIELELQNDELQRLRAEQQAQLMRYAEFYDLAPVACLTLDHDGVIGRLNNAAAKLLGRGRTELTGQRLRSFVAPESLLVLDILLPEIFAAQTVQSYELTIQPPGQPCRAARMDVVVASDPHECHAIISDITEHRNVEQALWERESRLREQAALIEGQQKMNAVVETALDAVVRMDASGHVVAWNPQAEVIFGWTANEAIGRSMHDTIIPPQYRARHIHGMQHFLATGQAKILNKRLELSALHSDGREFPIELTIALLKTQEQVEFSAFIRDISARKQAETVQRELEAQLRESQKMQAIGTLAGGVAHDFNNILAAILGNVALASQEIEARHAVIDCLDQIKKSALRARSLVQQILTFSHRQPQALVCQPLQPLVEETVAMLRATVPAMAVVEVTMPGEPLHGLIDVTQIHQVLTNLGTNAWHALQGAGGRIGIDLDTVDLSAEATHRPGGLPPGRYARLRVSDTGCGMDAATQARVFEPFFSTKSVDQGIGLGLAVVHGIVSTHHGAITLESKPGVGSRFDVYLPLVDRPEETSTPAVTESEVMIGQGILAPEKGRHVLCVDDDEAMLVVVESFLRRAGYRVTAHRNPHEAVATVRGQASDIDIVVTDFNMPEMSGLDLAIELAHIRPDLPVVVSSGYVTEELRTLASQAGVRAVLNKEHTFDELVGILDRIVSLEPAVDGKSAEGKPAAKAKSGRNG